MEEMDGVQVDATGTDEGSQLSRAVEARRYEDVGTRGDERREPGTRRQVREAGRRRGLTSERADGLRDRAARIMLGQKGDVVQDERQRDLQPIASSQQAGL